MSETMSTRRRAAGTAPHPVAIWARDADLEERARLQKEKAGGNRGLGLLSLAFGTLGIVYGDIGTSPLYVYGSVYPNAGPEDINRLLGTFSTIFWTITAFVLIKYVLLTLRADDNGEGGILALYALIKRAAGIRNPAESKTHATDHSLSNYNAGGGGRRTHRVASWLKASLRGSRTQQAVLLLVVLLAVNMIIADGVLTPAISVISAVQGIQYNAHISNSAVVGITCAILVVLFFLQGFGTSKISFLFSPVLLLWFGANAAIGLYNIIHYSPSIWKGLSPHYMYYYWSGDAHTAWINLGAVMLCMTGGEALYADLGHFNARSIQLSFLTIVYPSLTFTYLGQTAYLAVNPADAPNTFWASLPRPVYWPMVVVATLAAIIASQAMITGAFSVIRQGIAMNCFPRFTVRHTNAHYSGQVYLPEVNYLIMAGCLAVVVGFQNATNIGNAYGLAIIFVMLLDTSLLSMVMLLGWEWPTAVVVAFWLPFTFLSGAYLSSNLNKVPHGAWFTLMLAVILSAITSVYLYGQTKKRAYIAEHAVALDDLFEAGGEEEKEAEAETVWRRRIERHSAQSAATTDSSKSGETGAVALHPGLQRLRLAGTKLPVARVPGIGIYYSELLSGVPPVLVRFLSLAPTIHEVVVFLTIRSVPVPNVFADERLLIRKLSGFEGFFQVVARYGYMDKVDQSPSFIKEVMEEILEYTQADDGLDDDANGNAGGDLESGGGGGAELPSGEGHVAVEVDPTASLSSVAGQKMLREINARLRGRAATDTVTSNGSSTSRPMVAITMPLDDSVEGRSAEDGPWMQQPSVLRRVRMTALQHKTLSSGDADSERSVPLPPPPPRPVIYRRPAKAKRPGGGAGGSATVEVSPSATLTSQGAAALREELKAARLAGPDHERDLLLAAYQHGMVHLVGSSKLHAKDTRGLNSVKAFVLNVLYNGMVQNTRPAAAAYNLPLDTLLELAVSYEV